MTDSSVQSFDTDLLESLAQKYGTPLYVFDWRRILQNRQRLFDLTIALPVRNWLSMKTAPIKPLISAWRELGERIEVVSEFELLAAISVGYVAGDILVNGPGKIRWMGRVELRRLNVIFDSLLECERLGTQARELGWTVGLRLTPSVQRDPDDETYRGQFGISAEQLHTAIGVLSRQGVQIDGVQFHLRSNVSEVGDYRAAVSEILSAVDALALKPRFLDCGGGLPSRGEIVRSTGLPTWSDDFNQFGGILASALNSSPSIEEIWLENGRFLLADAGALVFSVLDVKARTEASYVICDGGRITNAFPSDWERHELNVIPARKSSATNYSICGPTCMAYDWIERRSIEFDIQPGDLIVWHNAGAYHLPWETRFSCGLAAVVWVDGNGNPSLVREREQFEHWWGTWS